MSNITDTSLSYITDNFEIKSERTTIFVVSIKTYEAYLTYKQARALYFIHQPMTVTAKQLNTTPSAIYSLLERVAKKLGAVNRTQLKRWAEQYEFKQQLKEQGVDSHEQYD